MNRKDRKGSTKALEDGEAVRAVAGARQPDAGGEAKSLAGR